MDAENNVIVPEGIFTEDNLKEVAGSLGNDDNERLKLLNSILDGSANIDNEEVLPEVNEEGTGEVDILKIIDKESSKINLVDLAIEGLESNSISMDELLEKSKTIFPANNKEDIMAMLKIAKRYKDGEEFSVYSALPENIKAMVKQEAGGLDKNSLNLFSKMLIEEFCTEVFGMAMDKEVIDFNAALKEALNIPDITQLYEGYIRGQMEVELLKKADALEEQFPNAAIVLRKCSNAFTDSYTFTRQRNNLKGKTKRKLYKDNEFYDRFCREFNYSNAKSKFRITDVYELGKVLDMLMPFTGMSNDDVLMFVILFCKTCIPLNSDDTSDAMFMYYSIRNIINMEHHGFIEVPDSPIPEFDKVIIDNIKILVNEIHILVNNKDEGGNKVCQL